MTTPRWRKSSFSGSGGNCVEVARLHDWRKSSFSGSQGNCVEVGQLAGSIGIRNSNDPDAGTLVFAANPMAAFIASVKAGELDEHV